MASYTGAMYVGGETYNSTAGGYQIGGNDAADANATCQLPSEFATYKSCRITCTFYSATAPSSWSSSWGCYLGVYKNGSLYGGDTQWINKGYFNDGGGSSSRSFSCNLTGGTFEAGDSITIKFIGSNGGFVDSSGRCVYLTGAQFYSANAELLKVTLKYSANGGSYAPAEASKYVNADGYAPFTVTSLQPTRNGFAFVGWAESPGGYAAYGPGDSIDLYENLTLYAVWEKIAYTITYEDNGADSGLPPVDDTEYDSGATVTILGNTGDMELDGYTFAGWNTEPDGSGTTYMAGDKLNITGAVTLYAIWVEAEQLFIYTGSAWQRGEPQIFNGTTWQTGELSLYADDTWNS